MSSDDIVDRLRNPHWATMAEAADEIEQLRADRDRWRRAAIKMAPAAGPAWTPRFVWDALPEDDDEQ